MGGYEGLKVKLGGKKYEHALSLHPAPRSKAFASFALEKPWEKFEATVGIADSASPHDRQLIFRVLADGRAVYESDPMSETGASEKVKVKFPNTISELKLEVEAPGGNACSHAVFVDPVLVP